MKNDVESLRRLGPGENKLSSDFADLFMQINADLDIKIYLCHLRSNLRLSVGTCLEELLNDERSDARKAEQRYKAD